MHLQAAEGDRDADIIWGYKETAEPLEEGGRNPCPMPQAASSASLHTSPATPHFHQVFLNWLRDMVTSAGLTTHPFPTPGPCAKALHPSAKGPSEVLVLPHRTLVQYLARRHRAGLPPAFLSTAVGLLGRRWHRCLLHLAAFQGLRTLPHFFSASTHPLTTVPFSRPNTPAPAGFAHACLQLWEITQM